MNDFARVKKELNLFNVITGETGLKIKNAHLESCPFCDGHDCFSVQPDRDFYKCFQCNEGGDVFNFLQLFYNTNKKDALEKAAAIAGIQLSTSSTQKRRFTVTEKILIETAKHYHKNMLSNGGQDYLTNKRGHNINTLKKMQVGVSDGELLGHLRRTYSDDDIKKTGITKERKIKGEPTLVDFFDKSLLVYPHFISGKVRHFTSKDPRKKKPPYQLKKKYRHKEWVFYNQDAINKHDELILLEGEDDLQSVLDSKIENVIGLIGQVSDEQIKALDMKCRKKVLFIWMDNDEANPNTRKKPGHEYIRKICTGLKNIDIKIILYPDNQDPDQYLQNFRGDRRKEIKRLMDEAVDFISWEITQAAQEPNLEDKLKKLKDNNVFQMITIQPEIKQQIYIEKLESLGFTKKAIAEQIESKIDIKRKLNIYFETLARKADADPIFIANLLFNFFSKDGRFYKTRDKNVFLLYQNTTYEISNNLPFNALIMRLTDLLPTKEPGRSVWVALANMGYNSGIEITMASWIHTDKDTDTIYINLNSPQNMILKITQKHGVKEIPNGLNEDNVLLNSSNSILPFTYLPDTDPHEGFRVIKNLIFDNLTCEKEQRYLIMCWLISAFLIDFVSKQALLKFAGATASGKTTGAKLLSILVYGTEEVGAPTAAAAFAEASKNPMLLIDNLESNDITSAMKDFLLLSASRSNKSKRTSGTESDTTKEKPKALVLVTAIEPFTLAEMINRTIEIFFDKKFHGDGFIEDEVARELIKKRDIIISSILKVISKKIIPSLSDRKTYISILQKQHKGHSKERNNEYIALLMVILDKILPYLPFYSEEDFLYGIESGAPDIWKAWIEYQDTRARDTEAGSNNILKMLDGIVREYIYKIKELKLTPDIVFGYDEEVFVYQHPDYGLKLIKSKPIKKSENEYEDYTETHIEFVAMASEIVGAFDTFCKNKGIKNPYSSPAVFGRRLENDLVILKKEGWALDAKESIYPYYKKVRGKRFYKFLNTRIS